MSGANTCKVHQALARALVDHGADVLFGLMGDGNLFMVDHYIRELGGRFVGAAYEGNAVLMAHGWAQANGRVGVATVTHGPGLTNTVTALVEAVHSHTPLVLLAGDTPAMQPRHLQKIDQRALIEATGARFFPMRSPESGVEDLAAAFYLAETEQRPVVFNMPIEYQWLDVAYEKVVRPVPTRRGYVPASDDLDRAVGIIATAKRPILLAGRGALDAREPLLRLAARIEAPLATTLRAKALFRGEAWDLGIFGTLSTEAALDAIAASDCIIAFGASLAARTRGEQRHSNTGGLFTGKRVVQIEIDATTVGRDYFPTAAVIGDAALTAERICALLDEADLPGSGNRTPALEAALSAKPSAPQSKSSLAAGTIDVHKALSRLDEALPVGRILVTDTGRFMSDALKTFSVDAPQHLVFASGFAAVGCGFGSAIGAAIRADGPTLLVCGDGGFMMNGLNEIYTAIREKLDLVIVVCNDACYGAEYVQFRHRGMDAANACLQWPSLAQAAAGVGFDAMAVRDAEALEQAVAKIQHRTGPVLIELMLDPARATG